MKRLKTICVLSALAVFAAACGNDQSSDPTRLTPLRVAVDAFGTTTDGQAVERYTLRNGAGAEMVVITYGGILQSLKVPDRQGVFDNVVVGFDTLAEYEAQPHELHGGVTAWNTAVWEADPFQDAVGAGVLLTGVTPIADGVSPATATAHVRYTLTPTNEVIVQYHATAGAPAIIHMPRLSLFNLGGAQTTNITGHEFTVHPRTGEGLVLAASAHDPATGRTLDIRATAPALQFYTANPSGFSIEMPTPPGVTTQPSFPSIALEAKGEHSSQIVFAFGVR